MLINSVGKYIYDKIHGIGQLFKGDSMFRNNHQRTIYYHLFDIKQIKFQVYC